MDVVSAVKWIWISTTQPQHIKKEEKYVKTMQNDSHQPTMKGLFLFCHQYSSDPVRSPSVRRHLGVSTPNPPGSKDLRENCFLGRFLAQKKKKRLGVSQHLRPLFETFGSGIFQGNQQVNDLFTRMDPILEKSPQFSLSVAPPMAVKSLPK